MQQATFIFSVCANITVVEPIVPVVEPTRRDCAQVNAKQKGKDGCELCVVLLPAAAICPISLKAVSPQ